MDQFDFDDNGDGADSPNPLIVRSQVQPKTNYRDYLEYLRYDFFILAVIARCRNSRRKEFRFKLIITNPFQPSRRSSVRMTTLFIPAKNVTV